MDDPQTVYGRFSLGYAMVRSMIREEIGVPKNLDVLDAYIFQCMSVEHMDTSFYWLVDISPCCYEDVDQFNEDFETISEESWNIFKSLYLTLDVKKKDAIDELVEIIREDIHSRPSRENPLSREPFNKIAAIYSDFGYPESPFVHEVFVNVLSIEAECDELYGPIAELKESLFSIVSRF